MKIKHIIFLIIGYLCLVSCGKDEETEVEYNEKIQDTFFGVKFGANKEDVVNGFAKDSIILINENATEVLTFHKSWEDFINFGGLPWDFVNVHFDENKFYQIIFCYSLDLKNTEMTLNHFNEVLSIVSEKYVLYEMPIQNEKTYKDYRGFSKNGKLIMILCGEFENKKGKNVNYVYLSYADETFCSFIDEL